MVGVSFGMQKGHSVTKRTPRTKRATVKGVVNKRVKMIRSVVREVAGFAPYERRLMELLKVGRDKRALRLAKKKLGTHKRAKAKREYCQDVLTAQRKAAAH